MAPRDGHTHNWPWLAPLLLLCMVAVAQSGRGVVVLDAEAAGVEIGEHCRPAAWCAPGLSQAVVSRSGAVELEQVVGGGDQPPFRPAGGSAAA